MNNDIGNVPELFGIVLTLLNDNYLKTGDVTYLPRCDKLQIICCIYTAI